MTYLAALDLPTLRAACNAATNGPWVYCYDGSSDWTLGEAPDPQEKPVCHFWDYDDRPETRANLAFIALARTALPQALDVIEQLAEALEWIKAVNISSPTTQEKCNAALALVRRGEEERP